MAASKYISGGVVARPHGVRGELVVDSHADSPTYFARGSTLRLSPPSDPGRGRDYVVRAARPHQERILLTLDSITDRNAAETLRGLAVCVPVERLTPPAPDEVFLQDILLAAFRIPDAVRSLLHQEKALHSGSPLQSDYGDAASCLIFPPHLSDGQRSKNARSEILSTDDQQEKALFMTVL